MLFIDSDGHETVRADEPLKVFVKVLFFIVLVIFVRPH